MAIQSKFNSGKKGIGDDLRQSFAVMKNELVKFFRGKKLLLFSALTVFVLCIITFLPYALGHSLPGDRNELSVRYISFVTIVIMLMAILFPSTQLVSEFEERTALILFTRPIKKISIFIGKMWASLLVGGMFVTVYYAVTCIVSLIVAGGIGGHMAESYGLALLYVGSMSGLAFLISSITKKASTSTMLTFFVTLLLAPIISGVLSTYNIETWWNITDVDDAIYGVLDGYLAHMTGMMSSMGMPFTPEPVDIGRSACTMVAWFVSTSVLAFIMFRKRDF